MQRARAHKVRQPRSLFRLPPSWVSECRRCRHGLRLVTSQADRVKFACLAEQNGDRADDVNRFTETFIRQIQQNDTTFTNKT